MIWFTADTHFGHANIIKYCNRPFRDTTEMDGRLLDNLNSVVKPEDTLYHLGDFSFRSISEYRDRINCNNIHLILGNHDKAPHSKYRANFNSVSQYVELKLSNINFTLCHYAFRVWNKSHHGAIMLFGHSHNGLPEWGTSLDVGVDGHNYKPWSLDEVLDLMESRTIKTVDHHTLETPL